MKRVIVGRIANQSITFAIMRILVSDIVNLCFQIVGVLPVCPVFNYTAGV